VAVIGALCTLFRMCRPSFSAGCNAEELMHFCPPVYFWKKVLMTGAGAKSIREILLLILYDGCHLNCPSCKSNGTNHTQFV